jgi:hypothetical protein
MACGESLSEGGSMQRWQRVARRIRVPLGFAVASLYLFELWRQAPRQSAIEWSLALTIPGLWLRGYASGYVKKNRELTATGPYAHTRNPLYLGSMLIAAGFALALESWLIAVVLALGFAIVYIPVIASEERFLRAAFPRFDEYRRHVPRLIPRLTAFKGERNGAPAGSGITKGLAGGFSWALYGKHREYNAAIGAIFLYLSLLFLRPILQAIFPGAR